jgi:hypothetical protein
VPIHWQKLLAFTRSSRVKSEEKRSSAPLRSTWSELCSILSYCMILNSYRSVIMTVIPSHNLLLLGSLFCKYISRTVQNFEDVTHQKTWKTQPDHFQQILLQNMQIYLQCISVLNFTSAPNGSFVIATTLKSKTTFPRPMCYSQAKTKLSQKHFTIFEYNKIRCYATPN